MNQPIYGITRKRAVAAATIFIVATALAALLGVDMGAYLPGVAVGILLTAGVAWFARRRLK